MEWYQWVFSGVGGAILMGIIGFIIKKIFNKSNIHINGNNSGIITTGNKNTINKTTIIPNERDKNYIQSSIETIEMSDISIKIESPQNNKDFAHQVPVKGTIMNCSSEFEIWLVKEPHKGTFHPDRGPASITNTQWFSTAYIGNSEPYADQGNRFIIHAVIAPHSTGVKYNEYINKAHKTGNWSGIPSLFDGVIKDSVTVIRKDD